MLKGQILAVILYIACLTGLSEQATLTCEGTDEVDIPNSNDVRVVDGFQRSGANHLIFLGSDQDLTVIDGNKTITRNLGVCYSTSPIGCYIAGDDEADCDNYIRGVIDVNERCGGIDGCRRFLVCGTNAKLPRCAFCDYTGSRSELNCSFIQNDPPQDLPYIPANAGFTSCTSDNIDGQGVFQYRKNHNATVLYHEGSLYYGLVRGASMTYSIIGLAVIFQEGLITGKVITRTDSQKMVATEAHFVGKPFVNGDFVYFLFREPAQELASLSAGQRPIINSYYSRIARICKNDAGADVSSTQILTSFLKQRLMCSIEAEGSSFEYNEIQDFTRNGTMIHAIFTNGQNDAPQSALCKFSLTSIDDTFNSGTVFGADGGTNNDLWREYDGPVVSPRPGLDCSNPNTAATNYERDYNLMSDPAEGTVRFFLVGDRFSNLEMTSESDTEIYIISSEKGCLYKVEVNTPNETDLGDTCQDPVVSQPIKDLELTTDNGYLVTTLDNVTVLSNCNVYQPSPPSVFPSYGTYRVRPNSHFEFIYPIENELSSIMSNGMEITDSNDEAYRLLKNESLTGNLVHVRILILNETTEVIFSGSNLNYTIEPSECYTVDELELRCYEWNQTSIAHTYLNGPDTCQDGTGNFDNSVLLDYNQVRTCENCAYNDCVYNCS